MKLGKKIAHVFFYHVTSPLENSTLFFYLGFAVSQLVNSKQENARFSMFHLALVGFACMTFLWLLQERFFVISARLKDPFTFPHLNERLHLRRRAQAAGAATTAASLQIPTRKEEKGLTNPTVSSHGVSPSSSPLPSELERNKTGKDVERASMVAVIAQKYFKKESQFYEKLKYTIVNDDVNASAERALVARKFKLDDTCVLIENMVKFREAEGLDKILDVELDKAKLDIVRKCMQDGFYGEDREKYPCYWSSVGMTDLATAKTEVGINFLVKYHIQLFEFNQRFYFNEFSKRNGFTVYQTTCVVSSFRVVVVCLFFSNILY